jgi:uncharacterized protein
MPWQLLISGLLLGLAGSVHCVGMCGPLAFALPVQLLPKHKKVFGVLLYNIGRISTYTILGLVVGLLGKFLLVGKLQQWFAIVFGVSILTVLAMTFVFRKSLHITPLNKFYNKLQLFIAKRIQQQGLPTLFILGMANGLLPCGMVFIALTGAITTASHTDSMLYMLLYGLGTLPAMFALSYAGFVFNISLRNTVKKIAPVFLFVIAVLLILRGLNLNIPYVSPYFYQNNAEAVLCH